MTRVIANTDTYRVKATGETAEVLIYEEIGSEWFGGVSASQFAKDVKALGKVSEINLRINSPGGNVFDAVAMYNTLVNHKAVVTVDIDGLAASAASIPAMAGSPIRMADNAMMMIHDPWGIIIGNAVDAREFADTLDAIKGTLITTYGHQSHLSDEEIGELMADETWMNATEAKEHGFIDEVTEKMAVAASIDRRKFKYHNTPDGVLQIAAVEVTDEQVAAVTQRVASQRDRLNIYKEA